MQTMTNQYIQVIIVFIILWLFITSIVVYMYLAKIQYDSEHIGKSKGIYNESPK
jgi:hypothetical protein